MQTRWMWRCAVVLVLVVGAACARRVRTPPPPESFNGDYFRFATGLQLAVYEDPDATRVSVTVSYGSGSHLDPSGQEGTAHLVEHLTGLSRAAVDGRSIDARLFALGSQDNAFTSADETTYFADVPPAAFAPLLALEAERMRDPLANVTESELATERGVVTTELHQRAEEEDSLAGLTRIALSQLFADHPYGRAIGGTEASLAAIQLAHARQWARMHYTPDNAVIVVHGPVKAQAAKEQVERSFGGLAVGDTAHPASPPTTNSPPDAPVALTRQPTMRTVVAPISARELWLVWPAAGRVSGEEVRVRGAAVALDFALHRQLEDDKRIKTIDTVPLVMDGMSLVAVRLELHPHVDALQFHADLTRDFEVGGHQLWSGELADDVAEALSAEAFAELEQGFGPTAAQYVRATRRADFAAGWRQQVLTGATNTLFADAQRYFPRDQMRTLLFVPTAVGKAFRQAPPVRFVVESESDLSTRSLPEGAPSASTLLGALPPFESFELENGMRVVVVRRQRLPTVELRMVVRTSPYALTPELPLLAVLQSGGAYHVGAGQRMAYDGHVVWETRCRPDGVDLELGWMSDWVKNNRTYPEVHKYLTEGTAKELQRLPETAAPRVEDFPREHLFGRKPETFKQIADRVKTLGHQAVVDWLERELQPNRTTLILVGDLPPVEEIKSKVFWSFLGWSNTLPAGAGLGDGRVGWASTPPPKAAKALLQPRRAALAHVRVAVRAPKLHVQDLAQWTMLTSLLEDRLRAELRERKGIAYGVHATLERETQGSILSVDTSVRPEHAVEVVSFVREVLRRTAQEPLVAADLERARWDVARSFDAGFATLERIADRIHAAAINGDSPALWSHYKELLISADGAAVSKLAKDLVVGAEAITVVGNLAGIEGQLKTAGYAVEVVK